MDQDAELAGFDAFIGEWTTDATHPALPGAEVRGQAVFEWHGTLTVHDNGTDLGRPPRAVRYSIDAKRRTATLLESITDPRVGNSICCGSARKLDDGNWLIGWGGNGVASLVTPHGQLISSFTIDDVFSYRTIAFPEDAVDRADLRAGMDALYAAGEAD